MSESTTPTPPTPKPPSAELALNEAKPSELAAANVVGNPEAGPIESKSDEAGNPTQPAHSQVVTPAPQAVKERTNIASFIFGGDWAEKVVRGDYPEPVTPIRHAQDTEHLHVLPKGKESALPGRKRPRILSEGTIGEDIAERVRNEHPPPYHDASIQGQGGQGVARQLWPNPALMGTPIGHASHASHPGAAEQPPTRNMAAQATGHPVHGMFNMRPSLNATTPHAQQNAATPPLQHAMPATHFQGEAQQSAFRGIDFSQHAAYPAPPGSAVNDHVIITAELYEALLRRQTQTLPSQNIWNPTTDAQYDLGGQNGQHLPLPHQPGPPPFVATATTWNDVLIAAPTPVPAMGRSIRAQPALDLRAADRMDVDGKTPHAPTPNMSHGQQTGAPQVTRTAVDLLIEAGSVLCTPRPHGGFPAFEGRGPFDALRHASASRLAAWLSLPAERRFLFDVVGKLSFTEEEATDLTTFVEGKFYQITGEVGAVFLPPEPRLPDVPKEDGPSAWLVCGFSAEATATIVEHGVFSYDQRISLIVYSGDHLPPKYVLSLEGFNQDKKEPIEAAVREVLAQEHVLKATIKAAGIGPTCVGVDPKIVAATLPGSLEIGIEKLKDGKTIAHVYLVSPTKDPQAWNEWRDTLRAQKYTNIFLPKTVRVRPPRRCFACHAADHSVDACELPTVPGWRGPTKQDLAARAETEPIPAADQPARGSGMPQGARWLHAPGTMRGGMQPGPSSGGPRSQRNPNRPFGRN
ncbi:hypothetical protein C2E23DRAFT_887576 [Lenzites betulinus]|nr:hypothetical protein C2E23DRAFT_887576 [Lenzites betulinus]